LKWFKLLSVASFSASILILLAVIYYLIKYCQNEIKSRKRNKINKYLQALHEAVSNDERSSSNMSSKISVIDMEKQFEKNLKAEMFGKKTSAA